MSLPKAFTLSSGAELPAVGLGTFQAAAGNGLVEEQVATAIRLGYRHIDTAAGYGNEKDVGAGIRKSNVARGELFVTTKLDQTWHRPEDVEEALNLSLANLGLEYVDLYLMHFPHAYQFGDNHSTKRHPDGSGRPMIDLELSRNYLSTWQAMEKLVDSGKAKAIGVSNFNILKTRRIVEAARIRPAVNQVELHPLFPQHELVEYCNTQGIQVMAHQPLGGAPVAQVRAHTNVPSPLRHAKIVALAEGCGKTPAQICLSWAVQRGISVVPKTVNEGRMRENLDLGAKLEEAVFEGVNQIVGERGPIRFLNPQPHIGFDIFDEEEDQPVE